MTSSTSDSAAPRIGLLALPREMLQEIRSHIHCLAGHVAFSLVCRTTKSLYDDAFWRFACITAGWGKGVMSEKTEKTIKGKKAELWAGLARIVVKDAATFSANDSVPKWASMEVIDEAHLRNESKLRAKTPKDLKEDKIKLKVPEEYWADCDWDKKQKEMFTVPDYDKDDWPGPQVKEHPFVANRFLTVPPMTELHIGNGKNDFVKPATNEGGVLYWDACVQLAKHLAKLPKSYKNNTDHRHFERFTSNGGIVLDVFWGS